MTGILLAAVLLDGLPATAATDRVVRAELEVAAPVSEVWKAWTTEAGVRSFFAPAARIEPRVDGAYEIYFDPTAEPGQRGAEGMRILAFEPERRLAFTWNAPPSIPAIRGQRTMVVVELEPAREGRTRVRFRHLGWGEGKDWDAAFAYFDRAWTKVVLPRLQRRFESGPIDWPATREERPAPATLRM